MERDGLRFLEALVEAYRGVGTLSEAEVQRLFGHYQLLLRWNRVLNLTRISGLEDAVVRHYCESLFLADRMGPGSCALDVGSGGGFPGIPLAIRRAELRVTLAESHQRKAVFLREASRGLPNVDVRPQRAELIAQSVDWTVGRAVRWEEVARVAVSGVALLLGADDAAAAAESRHFRWEPPARLPWGRQRVLLIGCRRST